MPRSRYGIAGKDDVLPLATDYGNNRMGGRNGGCMGIFITIKPPPPGPNGSKGLFRMHWSRRLKLKKRIKAEVWAQTVLQPKPKGKILVSATRYAIKTMDPDNLIASLKIPIDCLVDLKICKDDSPGYLELGTMKQEKVRKRALERLELSISSPQDGSHKPIGS